MIHRQQHDAVTVLRLEHGKANALDLELLEAVGAELDHAAGAPETGAVVLTGSGSAFSAGVDLVRLQDGGAGYLDAFLGALSSRLLQLLALPLPVVAAVGGHAIAGGCVLAAACDLRVMTATGAKIGLTELRVGVPFPPAALEIVRALVPPSALPALVYRSQLIGPEQARACGLADELVEPAEVLPRAIALAAELATVPPATFALTKGQLREPVLAAIERENHRVGAEVNALWRAEETRAALDRFVATTLGKRPPAR